MGTPARQRIARFAQGGRVFYALLEGDDGAREVPGDPFRGLGEPGPLRSTVGLRWLTPCVPSKIVGVGRNYRAHIAELRHEAPAEPLLFLKPPSALLPPDGTIRLPERSRRVDYEGELGVVIARRARRVSEARALDYALGYTCVNDVTARDLQEVDVQFTRPKGFDTFCPFGPCIVTRLDPAGLVVETFVNGERRQSSPTDRMIFSVARLISFVSEVMTLEPGDLIATGTPEGVGPLRHGDEVAVSIEGIGRLSNRVESS
ncbi:MAG: fumarylacetoacetate hydrolase family protein [Acidobacteriota bacterium]